MHGLGGGLQRGGIPEAELAPQAGLAVEKDGRPGAAQSLIDRPAIVDFGPETIERSQGLDRSRKDPRSGFAGGSQAGKGARGQNRFALESPVERLVESGRGGVAAHRVDIGDVDPAPAMGEQGKLFELAAGKPAVGTEQVGEMVAGVVGEIEAGLRQDLGDGRSRS